MENSFTDPLCNSFNSFKLITIYTINFINKSAVTFQSAKNRLIILDWFIDEGRQVHMRSSRDQGRQKKK